MVEPGSPGSYIVSPSKKHPLSSIPRMADVFSKAKRSEVMSRIRPRENKGTELALMAFFRAHGHTGWRRRQPLFGKPDFVFRKTKVALFVDGCFWHGCPKHGTRPKTNTEFWNEKIRRNIARDRLVNRTLREAGWRVVRIWEHELHKKNAARLEARLRRRLPARSV
jgi:DNA mismatch endonuclease (patch repair protein)